MILVYECQRFNLQLANSTPKINTVPIRISATFMTITIFVCKENFHRRRRLTTSDITVKPMPPKIISKPIHAIRK